MTKVHRPNRRAFFSLICFGLLVPGVPGVQGAVVQFFNSSQIAVDVASGVVTDTISCEGYLFTYTRDKLFTGGGPDPIGRQVRVPWPQGVEAQAITTPPAGMTDHKARNTIARVDGSLFDLTAFTAKLLANTFGAGGAIEVMPQLNGDDGLNDPVMFMATGFAGQSFSYDESSPSYVGNTSLLKAFDTYKIGLYVDFALTGLTLFTEGTPGDFNNDALVDARDIDLLCDAINSGGSVGAFDLNGDGQLNGQDTTYQVETILNTSFGDTDTDGDVDLADLGNLATGFGQPGGKSWSLGNFDCDNDVDLNDLGTLATNFAGGGPAGGATLLESERLVPEPCAGMLLLALMPAVLRRREPRMRTTIRMVAVVMTER
jgi:hypothetical protein